MVHMLRLMIHYFSIEKCIKSGLKIGNQQLDRKHMERFNCRYIYNPNKKHRKERTGKMAFSANIY